MPDKHITFQIVKFIGTISQHNKKTRELNIIRWNGGTPKFDIREWDDSTGRMSRGITLHESEMRRVVNLFLDYQNAEIRGEGHAREDAQRKKVEELRQRAQEEREREDRQKAMKSEADADAYEGTRLPEEESALTPVSAAQEERSFDASGLDASPLVPDNDAEPDTDREPETDETKALDDEEKVPWVPVETSGTPEFEDGSF